MNAPLDLKDLLRRKGKTQSEVGLAQSYVSNIVTGRVRPGASAITTLADALGCTTDEVCAACDESYRRAQADARACPHAGNESHADVVAVNAAQGNLPTIDQPTAAPSAQGA